MTAAGTEGKVLIATKTTSRTMVTTVGAVNSTSTLLSLQWHTRSEFISQVWWHSASLTWKNPQVNINLTIKSLFFYSPLSPPPISLSAAPSFPLFWLMALIKGQLGFAGAQDQLKWRNNFVLSFMKLPPATHTHTHIWPGTQERQTHIYLITFSSGRQTGSETFIRLSEMMNRFISWH